MDQAASAERNVTVGAAITTYTHIVILIQICMQGDKVKVDCRLEGRKWGTRVQHCTSLYMKRPFIYGWLIQMLKQHTDAVDAYSGLLQPPQQVQAQAVLSVAARNGGG